MVFKVGGARFLSGRLPKNLLGNASLLAFLPPQTDGLSTALNSLETRRIPFVFLNGSDQVLLAMPSNVFNSKVSSHFSNSFQSHSLTPFHNSLIRERVAIISFLTASIAENQEEFEPLVIE